jgi:hypothetical protein
MDAVTKDDIRNWLGEELDSGGWKAQLLPKKDVGFAGILRICEGKRLYENESLFLCLRPQEAH